MKQPLCLTCLDFRHVQVTDHTIAKCPNCGALDADEYSRFRRAQIHRLSAEPELLLLDLTNDELAQYHRWKAEGISKQMALSWLEGRRYDPSKDAEFMATIPARLEAWQATRKGPE